MKKTKSRKNNKTILLISVVVAIVIAGASAWLWLQSPQGLQYRHEQTAKEFIGLSEEKAKEKAQQKGVEYRAVVVDGEGQAVNDDLSLKRINITLEDGTVTQAVFDKLPEDCGNLCWWIN